MSFGRIHAELRRILQKVGMKTDATQMFTFNNGNLHAQLRATDRSHIAAGASPDDNQIIRFCSHVHVLAVLTEK